MIMAGGFHLFPFRTQKLSLQAPMVLPGVPVGEWVVAGMIVVWKKDWTHPAWTFRRSLPPSKKESS